MDYFDWYAAYLHRTCPVVGGHRNLVTEVYRRRLKGETGILNKYYKKELRKSGVDLIVSSLFFGAEELEDCREGVAFPRGALIKKAMEMLAAFYADLEETKGTMRLVTDKGSLSRMTMKRGFSGRQAAGVLLCLEGFDMLEGEPELLRCFYAMGVRGAALTRQVKGEFPLITDKEAEALFLMEQLGMFVDGSRLSRETVWLLPSFTKKPFAASDERSLTEEDMGEIAERGGVIGVNACRELLLPENQENAAADAFCDRILYLKEKAGEEHVGFGLDMGAGNVPAGCKELKSVTAQLLRRGLSVETVKKIIGGNWIRYFRQIFRE